MSQNYSDEDVYSYGIVTQASILMGHHQFRYRLVTCSVLNSVIWYLNKYWFTGNNSSHKTQMFHSRKYFWIVHLKLGRHLRPGGGWPVAGTINASNCCSVTNNCATKSTVLIFYTVPSIFSCYHNQWNPGICYGRVMIEIWILWRRLYEVRV